MFQKFLFFIGIFAVVFLVCNVSVSTADSRDKDTMQQDKTTSIEEVKGKVGAAAESIGRYTAEQRDQAVNTARQELKDLDDSYDKLEEKVYKHWDRLSAETKQNWRKTRQQLREKRLEAAEWFGGVQRGSADAWDEIKKGYNRAYSELAQGWERARNEFSREAEDENASKEKK